MDERQALVRAICEDPEDDTRRLAFADWLDEHGEPERAEFIRRSISHGHDEAQAEFYRATVRYAPPFEEWRAWGMPMGWNVTCYRPLFVQRGFDNQNRSSLLVRGFVAELVCTQVEFIKHAAAIFAAHPVTSVTLWDREPSLYIHNTQGVYWFRGRTSYRNYPAHALQPELWDLLPDGNTYNTHADAHAAPSVACVAYGRGLVGLPPLKTASMPTLGSCPVG